MQIDIHFYGTYAIARLAGFDEKDAVVIATAAQFVDDSTDDNSEKNDEREMLFSISTAHHPKQAATRSWTHPEGHRLVWVPFHFYPGGRGKNLEEKLLCVKDSPIVRQMVKNHIEMHKKAFYLHLLGIMSHVYIDTFAHYGFSGFCSDLNKIDGDSIELDVKTPKIENYISDKAEKFFAKYKNEAKLFWQKIRDAGMSAGAEGLSDGLGHGAVATYPDRPYLKYKFKYEHGRYGNGTDSGCRNNPETFLEGLKKLHAHLTEAAKRKYANSSPKEFPEDEIKTILQMESEKEGRVKAWQKFIKETIGDTNAESYQGEDWAKQKDNFDKLKPPNNIGDAYRFHQAAAYHRWYTLKDLLPEHEIYVT